MNQSEYVTAATAADELHCSRSTVTRLLTQGKLDGVKQFGSWFILRASLDARLALVAQKSSPLVSDAVITGNASQLYRPQVRAAAPQVDTRTARERLEQQIASARTYTYIDLHGNRTAKERKR